VVPALLLAAGASFALFLLVLVAEVWFGLWVLGRRFERLDLSADVRT
jgi:hypothetical protein